MMCGRSSGQVRNGHFFRSQAAPPLRLHGGKKVCGFCGGNVYLEPDDSGMLPVDSAAYRTFPQRRAS
jgi:hypothetical protein